MSNPITRGQIARALECAYIESSELEEVIDNVLAMLESARAEAWDACMRSAYIDGVNRRVVNKPNPYRAYEKSGDAT